MDHVVKGFQKFALALEQSVEYHKQRGGRQRHQRRGDRSIENEHGSLFVVNFVYYIQL